MKLATISIEVHRAKQPEWILNDILLNKNTYRLYINDELIAERTWTYGESAYVREQFALCVPTEKNQYILKVELVEKNIAYSGFLLDNLSSDVVIDHRAVNDSSLEFHFR